MLGVTGYEGVLGYRTKPSYAETIGQERWEKEVEEAKKVAECLKEHGWLLVSHSYGHPAYGNLTASRVEADSQKWEDTCEYIVGKTDIILYPHGSDINGPGKYTMDNGKFKALYEDGYRYFFNVDSKVAWIQIGENYFRGGRRNIDGYRMYHYPEKLEDLFDVSEVFDPDRPTPVPTI
jgi:peptidoglycan/xylan/chitin deacetylase (PgdA/CDA1 family)